MIALACSAPPDGRDHWSLRLLADRLVVLAVVEEVSHETVRQVLKKTNSSRGRSGNGASRRQANAEFVCAMEDTLDVYKRPYDPSHPQVSHG